MKCVLPLLLASLLVTSAVGDDPKKPKFTVGRDTTYVTGPLDKDGYIDYPAALNERLGKDVMPGTNANVLLWKALGPTPAGYKRRSDRFFELLGMEEPLATGDYFIEFDQFVRDRRKVTDPAAATALGASRSRAARQPWRPADHREVADWLRSNDQAINLIVEASRRPAYFCPIASGSILGWTDIVCLEGRDMATALAVRAMAKAGDGKPDEAWQDLLACHRLARLVGRSGGMMGFQVSARMEQISADADVELLAAIEVGPERIRKWARDLSALPPPRSAADCVDVGERFLLLNEVMMFARHGFRYVDQLAGGDGKTLSDEPVPSVNWDPGLRAANQWYDAVAAAMREPDRLTRQARLERCESDRKKLKDRDKTISDYARAVLDLGMSPTARGQFCGDLLLGLVAPAPLKLQLTADLYEQTNRNLRIAFALGAYRADHKGFPQALAELTPPYLDKVPDDLFTGKPLVYRPAEAGYLLYSLGPNGKDDGGRGPTDDPKGDDIAVRVPMPAPAAK